MNTFHNIVKREPQYETAYVKFQNWPKNHYPFFRGIISEKQNQSKIKCLLYSKTLNNYLKELANRIVGVEESEIFGAD